MGFLIIVLKILVGLVVFKFGMDLLVTVSDAFSGPAKKDK